MEVRAHGRVERDEVIRSECVYIVVLKQPCFLHPTRFYVKVVCKTLASGEAPVGQNQIRTRKHVRGTGGYKKLIGCRLIGVNISKTLPIPGTYIIYKRRPPLR